MLTEHTVRLVQSLTPAIAPHVDTITCKFYQRMFAANPEVQKFFNPAHQAGGQQPRALADAICAYFTHIDDLEALGPDVDRIAHKHCALGVQPEHYPIVGQHLLAAIEEVMGEAATEEVVAAIGEAYGVLADVCIDREKEIYQHQRSVRGGWNGTRHFVVDQKVPESETVTSFYLRPADGQPLADFLPGQSLTLHADLDPPTPPRQYSLSDRPGTGYYRISVKRESGRSAQDPRGKVSNWLHDSISAGDSVKIGPPCGVFTLDPAEADDRPAVFLAAGIGVTPLLSMAKSLSHDRPAVPLCFLQAARNGREHAMGNEVRRLAEGRADVVTRVFYDEPTPEDVELGRLDAEGRLTTEVLQQWTPTDRAVYYFCGPPAFMACTRENLLSLGVPESRIRFEFFGPSQNLAARPEAAQH